MLIKEIKCEKRQLIKERMKTLLDHIETKYLKLVSGYHQLNI